MLQVLLSRLDVVVPSGAAVLFLLTGVILLITLDAPGDKKSHFYALLIPSIGVFIALSLSFYRFTIDDTYISLRYARNLADGYGLVFSTDGSTPIEGYSNFLWVLAETLPFLLRLPDDLVLHAVKLSGLAFGVGVIIATSLLIRLLTRNSRVALLGALFLSATPQLSFWAVGGLETSMYIFWLVIGLASYIAEQRNGKRHLWSMVFLTLMALTRPEGVLFVLAILLWIFATTVLTKNGTGPAQGIADIMPGIAIFALVYIAYFSWRFRYYGFLLPNTFYARSGSLDIDQVLRRLAEMSPFIIYLLPLTVLAWYGFFRLPHHSDREKGVLAVAGLSLAAFSFASKREWMPGFRYELPYIPILILFASLGVHHMLFWDAGNPTSPWKAFMARLGVMSCLGLFLIYPAVGLQKNGGGYTQGLDRAHIAFGQWLRQYAPKDASYASWDMGAVPYYSELPLIIDIHPEGILNTHTTHNGYDVDYFLSLSPSFVVLPPEPDPSRSEGIYGFYLDTEFRQNYQPLFSFAFTRDYVLAVYKHNRANIPQHALDEGNRLAERSFAEAYSTIP